MSDHDPASFDEALEQLSVAKIIIKNLSNEIARLKAHLSPPLPDGLPQEILDLAESKPRRFIEPSLEEVKLAFSKAGAPEVEAEKFYHFYASKGWYVGKNKMKSVPHAIGGWLARNRVGPGYIPGVPGRIIPAMPFRTAPASGKREAWMVQKEIAFLESEAQKIKNERCYDGPLGSQWDNEQAKTQYWALRNKIKELKKELL